MHRWFRCACSVSSDGSFLVKRLEPLTGPNYPNIEEFIEQLANHVVGYVSRANTSLGGVFNSRYQIDADDKSFAVQNIERLLQVDKNGWRRDLSGFVGECLAHWSYVTFASFLAVSEPKPFSRDPAFDLLSIVYQEELYTSCIQAKTSAGWAVAECAEAVRKFGRLHSGQFDYELNAELHLLARNPEIRKRLVNRSARAVSMDINRRQYMVFIAFSGDSPANGLRQFAEVVSGSPDRRILMMLQLPDFRLLIEKLAEVIYAKLN